MFVAGNERGKLSLWDTVLGVIGAFATLGAVALCTEPAVPRFWLKLGMFVAVAGLCVLLTKKKAGVLGGIALFVLLRLVFAFVVYVIRPAHSG